MDPLALTLIELGAVVFCLGMLARLAGRIGMSPIPLYLVGGLFFGAGGLVKLEGMHEFAHLSGEIGVILLLLMLGLEYTAPSSSPGCGGPGRPASWTCCSISCPVPCSR